MKMIRRPVISRVSKKPPSRPSTQLWEGDDLVGVDEAAPLPPEYTVPRFHHHAAAVSYASRYADANARSIHHPFPRKVSSCTERKRYLSESLGKYPIDTRPSFSVTCRAE